MNRNRTHTLPVSSIALIALASLLLSACSGLRSELGGIFGGFEAQPDIGVAGEEPVPEPVETQVSATFDASASGSVCSNGIVFDGQPPQPIGETGEDYGPNYAPNTESCTGFWTFSLRGVASNVTVTAATFAPGECHVFNDPFKGNSTLQFDGVDVGPTLEAGDIPYASLANLGNWANCPFPMDVTTFVQSRVMAGASSVQFGAYMTFPQFGDGQESNVWFANDAWNVPTLTIRSY